MLPHDIVTGDANFVIEYTTLPMIHPNLVDLRSIKDDNTPASCPSKQLRGQLDGSDTQLDDALKGAKCHLIHPMLYFIFK